ncbi:unnamed protein product, partial [Laminaria digitata]
TAGPTVPARSTPSPLFSPRVTSAATIDPMGAAMAAAAQVAATASVAATATAATAPVNGHGFAAARKRPAAGPVTGDDAHGAPKKLKGDLAARKVKAPAQILPRPPLRLPVPLPAADAEAAAAAAAVAAAASAASASAGPLARTASVSSSSCSAGESSPAVMLTEDESRAFPWMNEKVELPSATPAPAPPVVHGGCLAVGSGVVSEGPGKGMLAAAAVAGAGLVARGVGGSSSEGSPWRAPSSPAQAQPSLLQLQPRPRPPQVCPVDGAGTEVSPETAPQGRGGSATAAAAAAAAGAAGAAARAPPGAGMRQPRPQGVGHLGGHPPWHLQQAGRTQAEMADAGARVAAAVTSATAAHAARGRGEVPPISVSVGPPYSSAVAMAAAPPAASTAGGIGAGYGVGVGGVRRPSPAVYASPPPVVIAAAPAPGDGAAAAAAAASAAVAAAAAAAAVAEAAAHAAIQAASRRDAAVDNSSRTNRDAMEGVTNATQFKDRLLRANEVMTKLVNKRMQAEENARAAIRHEAAAVARFRVAQDRHRQLKNRLEQLQPPPPADAVGGGVAGAAAMWPNGNSSSAGNGGNPTLSSGFVPIFNPGASSSAAVGNGVGYSSAGVSN